MKYLKKTKTDLQGVLRFRLAYCLDYYSKQNKNGALRRKKAVLSDENEVGFIFLILSQSFHIPTKE